MDRRHHAVGGAFIGRANRCPHDPAGIFQERRIELGAAQELGPGVEVGYLRT